MRKKLLLFRADQDRVREIRRLVRKMDIEVEGIERPMYGQKIGYLAGMIGFAEERRVYMGEELAEEMMLLVGFGQRDLDWLLAAWKEMAVPGVKLKALVTKTNIQWTPPRLFQELREEDEQMNPGR